MTEFNICHIPPGYFSGPLLGWIRQPTSKEFCKLSLTIIQVEITRIYIHRFFNHRLRLYFMQGSLLHNIFKVVEGLIILRVRVFVV
jgi:hypothetical protein